MSFSSKVKTELCKISLSKHCCAVAEAYGVLLYSNMFTKHQIKIVTGSNEFAERLPKLFKKAFGCKFDERPSTEIKGKIVLSISDTNNVRNIFSAYGYEAESILAHHINLGVLEENCCKAAFLRGAFLAGGSITDPEKSYHLELVTDHYNVSRETFSILLELGFSPKDTQRMGNYITYFKQSEVIEDLLTLIGAPISAMDIMSAKVEKGVRNTANRLVNCDSANADRVVSAASQQIEAIRIIERSIGLESLPEKLKQTAILRIANPVASLSDMAQLSIPPVSKSCISHRLHKLMNLAKEQQ